MSVPLSTPKRRSTDHLVDPLDHVRPRPVGQATPGPTLRRDAARNRDKILAAARVAFDEEGVDVGVECIAQRAGVGVGTLYRRFPTKELLIEAVVNEVLARVLAAAEGAMEHESPADGFTEYLRAVGWLQFEHAGCMARLWNDTPDEVRKEIETVTRALLTRAQAAGAVRDDLVYEDVVVLFWSLRGVIEATASVSPDAWLRHLELLLTSLEPGGRRLQHPPLTAEQAERAKRAQAVRDPRRTTVSAV
jgi:AcrR family transcriptional regulator